MTRWLRALSIASLVAIVFGVMSMWSDEWVQDDALIFYRYVTNLLQHGEIAFNPAGPPTYGVSSLGHLLVMLPWQLVAGDPTRVVMMSSLTIGAIGIALMVVIARRAASSRAAALAATTLLLVVLAGSHPILTMHLVSGMDTMTSLTYLAAFTLVMIEIERGSSSRTVAIAGVLAGAATWVRPDLLVFTLGLPLALAVFPDRPHHRAQARRIFTIAIPMVIAAVLVSVAWLHSPLPLPFWAKAGRAYDPLVTTTMGEGLRDLEQFLWWARFPALSLIAVAILGPRPAWRSSSPLVKGAIFTCAVFSGFYALRVVLAMEYVGRFHYPSLPMLLLIGVRLGEPAWRALDRRFAERRRFIVTGIVAVLIASGVYVVTAAIRREAAGLAEERARQVWGRADLPALYHDLTAVQLACLDVLSPFPDDLVIATTEVGATGAMYPRKEIVDLAGLNERDWIREPFQVGRMLARHPDVVFVPTKDFPTIRAKILSSPEFIAQYDTIDGALTHTDSATALRRASPHYAALRSLFPACSHPPGFAAPQTR